MPIIVPAILLVAVFAALVLLTGEVAWRHHVGVETERSFRTSAEATRTTTDTTSHTGPIAA